VATGAEYDQYNLFDEAVLSEHGGEGRHELTPAERWNTETVQHALDELFNLARQYRSSKSYRELIDFISRFRFYSPYNAFLIHTQMPGATFVAPAHRWAYEYGRFIKPNGHPLVILRPMGPVMFVFDVADTEPGPEARPLPREIERPFEVWRGHVGSQLEYTIENAKRDGVRILVQNEGSQSAGFICKLDPRKSISILQFQISKDKDGTPIYAPIPVRYSLVSNENLGREAIYATMVHELAHLYCGHLGTPNEKWWPDRGGLGKEIREFEAESITYLICRRIGIDTPSDSYLSGYLREKEEIPPISLECVMKACGLIEQMGRERLKMRKETRVISRDQIVSRPPEG
jgi:hypothetical protein